MVKLRTSIRASELSEQGELNHGPGDGKRRQCVDLIKVVGALHKPILALLKVFVDTRDVHSLLQTESVLVFSVNQSECQS